MPQITGTRLESPAMPLSEIALEVNTIYTLICLTVTSCALICTVINLISIRTNRQQIKACIAMGRKIGGQLKASREYFAQKVQVLEALERESLENQKAFQQQITEIIKQQDRIEGKVVTIKDRQAEFQNKINNQSEASGNAVNIYKNKNPENELLLALLRQIVDNAQKKPDKPI